MHHMLPADHARNWHEFMDSLMWTFDSDALAQHGAACVVYWGRSAFPYCAA